MVLGPAPIYFTDLLQNLKIGLVFNKLNDNFTATVSSVKAKELSYGESMFKRLFKFFDGQPDQEKNPVLKLRVQYRMHPDIVKWPNHYFYGGILRQVLKMVSGKE